MRAGTRKGFTLIEMLVVVLIISVLTAIGAPQYFKIIERARVIEATTTLTSMRSAQERILASNGNYAKSNAELAGMDINVQGEHPTFGMKNFFMVVGPGEQSPECAEGNPYYNIAFVRLTANAGVVPRYFENYMMVYERCSDRVTFPGCENCEKDFI